MDNFKNLTWYIWLFVIDFAIFLLEIETSTLVIRPRLRLGVWWDSNVIGETPITAIFASIPILHPLYDLDIIAYPGPNPDAGLPDLC